MDAPHDGPISSGIRDAVRTSDKTPYAIAKAVTARGKVKLTGPQFYRFLNKQKGLSLAILDEIAVVLDLAVHKLPPEQRRSKWSPYREIFQDRLDRMEAIAVDETTSVEQRIEALDEAYNSIYRENLWEGSEIPVLFSRLNSLKQDVRKEAVNKAPSSKPSHMSKSKPEPFDMDDDFDDNEDPFADIDLPSQPKPRRLMLWEIEARQRGEVTPPASPPSKEPEPNSFDDYVPSSGAFQRSKTQGEVHGPSVIEKIQNFRIAKSEDDKDFTVPPSEFMAKAMAKGGMMGQIAKRQYDIKRIPKIRNKGIIALAERYGNPKIRIDKYERARFYEFISEMQCNNPHFRQIDAMPDLADRYKMIAKKVRITRIMGTLGRIVTPEDLYLADQDPHKFFENLQRILMGQGIGNGVQGYSE